MSAAIVLRPTAHVDAVFTPKQSDGNGETRAARRSQRVPGQSKAVPEAARWLCVLWRAQAELVLISRRGAVLLMVFVLHCKSGGTGRWATCRARPRVRCYEKDIEFQEAGVGSSTMALDVLCCVRSWVCLRFRLEYPLLQVPVSQCERPSRPKPACRDHRHHMTTAPAHFLRAIASPRPQARSQQPQGQKHRAARQLQSTWAKNKARLANCVDGSCRLLLLHAHCVTRCWAAVTAAASSLGLACESTADVFSDDAPTSLSHNLPSAGLKH